MDLKLGWLPGLWLVSGRDRGAGNAPQLQQSLCRQRLAIAGGLLDGHRLRVVLAPMPSAEALAAGRASVAWYCLGPGGQGYRALADCRRNWRGWQVDWQLQPLAPAQLQRALAQDPQATARVFGRLRGQRLYA